MNKVLVGVGVAAVLAGGVWYFGSGSGAGAGSATPATADAGGAGRGGGRGRGAAPMTVDVGTAVRGEVVDYITVVGNLIGEATVDVVPRVAGRIESVFVQMGDRVTRGQAVVK